MKLQFLGASGTVTGSKYLLEFGNGKILVDCGLFQGLKNLRLLNWKTPHFDPAGIQDVFLTHGHLDHVGYLPRLVKGGFRGRIFGTALTLKIAEIILKDSAKVQEDEAERANKEGYSKHKPALPFYDLKDVEQTHTLFHPVQEGQSLKLENGLKVVFQYNGHILGSTFIQVEVEGKCLVFSGDIGRKKDLLLYPPKKPLQADVILMESTYGGQIHADEEEIILRLQQIVNETLERGGSLLIPSFAVERSQLLMLMLSRLVEEKKIPRVPMVLDSPMGVNIFDLFHQSQSWHKITTEEYTKMCSYFQFTRHYKETLQWRKDPTPKIVIAGSGMITGGRILDYLEVHAGNDKDTLLVVGYQSEGTRGRKLLEGEKTITLYGKELPFRMQLKTLEGLSAHADQADLLDWLSDLKQQPKKIFLIHGETEQAKAFQQKLKEVKHWDAEIPQLYQTVEI